MAQTNFYLNKNMKNILVISDIDGTLMDHSYDLKPALGTISKLHSYQIPLILCTSKTASEVRKIRDDIDLKDPFIVENGGAIYGNKKDSSEEWELILGRSFSYLRVILDKLSDEIGFPLRALNDLSFNEVETLTGLKSPDIELALDRHWSVPFLNPPAEFSLKLRQKLDKYQINIYQGNRMSHLLSRGSHKGKAVIALKKYLGCEDSYVIALGDSQNDVPLLEVADKAVLIPGPDGPNKLLLEGIKHKDFIIAPEPNALGWSIVVNKLITERLEELS